MGEWTKKDNETVYEYIKRMVTAKNDGVYGGTYSDWIYDVFNKKHSEDVSRREFYGCRLLVSAVNEDLFVPQQMMDAQLEEDMRRRELEIDKKRMQLSDEFRYVNRVKRELARFETLASYMIQAADSVSQSYPLVVAPLEPKEVDGNKGILCLSDWHYGLVAENIINKYSPEIAKQRINTLLAKVLDDIKLFNIDELVVANLGDLISGIIRTTIRLENRLDVITQVIDVGELLSGLLTELSKVVRIKYFSVIDNHSRVVANKEQSMDIENFNRSITYYVAQRCSGNPNIEFYSNAVDEGIMEFELNGWGFVGVHGHDDSPNSAANILSDMLHANYSVCLMGHYHSPHLREEHFRKTIINGCLCGVDEYAKQTRRSSQPSQNLIVVSKNSPCEYLHVINV